MRAPTPVDPTVPVNVQAFAAEDNGPRRRRSRRSLRVPGDEVPRPTPEPTPAEPSPTQTMRPRAPAEAPPVPMAPMAPVAPRPVPGPAAATATEEPPPAATTGGAAMRVVRRRIRNLGGEDLPLQAQVPLQAQGPPSPAMVGGVPEALPRPFSGPVTGSLRGLTPPPAPRPPEPPVPARVPEAVARPQEPPRAHPRSEAPAVTFAADEPTLEPDAPGVELAASDDFDVPPMDEDPTTEIATVGARDTQVDALPTLPPGRMSAPNLSAPPPAVTVVTAPSSAPPTRSVPPPTPLGAIPPAVAPRLLTPVPSRPSQPDDDGVEISLDEAELQERKSDPSLALLDALAELPGAHPLPEAEAPKAKSSVPPPPPPDAAKALGRLGSAPVPTGLQVPTVSAAAAARAAAVTIPDRRKRKLWWEELFNEDYLRTMEKLSPEQARAEADWIEHALGVETGATILDAACGTGRQAVELSRRGYDLLALDLSLAMLARGAELAQERGAKINFVQGDLCTMEYSEAFDAAYCIGSSFGYFDDPKNVELAQKIHHALKPHGTFLLEVANRDHVLARQPGMAWFEAEACVCMEETSFNYITSRLNVKRTVIFDDGRQRELEYSLRLYSLHELGQILHTAGFRILEVSGSARTPGAFFGAASRELIILAQKRGPEVVEIPTGPHDALRDG